MKSTIATMALATVLVGPTRASAQAPRGATAPPPAATPPAAAPKDARVFRSNQEIPQSQIVPPSPGATLPNEPVEPYLLQPEHGPFMVMAQTFRGPDATRYAVALARELRQSHGLPAYVFLLKINPNAGNLRGNPPHAERAVRSHVPDAPAGFRVYDEAAVLVGHCKTVDESEALLKVVKKIKPVCHDAMYIQSHNKGVGLKHAKQTVNPLKPAQDLYPGRPVTQHVVGKDFDPFQAIESLAMTKKIDPLVARLNSGPRSVYNCPGPYTLQVAEFSGRTTVNERDPRFHGDHFLKRSALATAHDDAEHLASYLAKHAAWTRGYQPYVYHDRSCSKVTIGSFASPHDPALQQLQKRLTQEVPIEVVKEEKIALPLAPRAILVGTSEGLRQHDAMVQRASTSVPEMIPIPPRTPAISRRSR